MYMEKGQDLRLPKRKSKAEQLDGLTRNTAEESAFLQMAFLRRIFFPLMEPLAFWCLRISDFTELV